MNLRPSHGAGVVVLLVLLLLAQPLQLVGRIEEDRTISSVSQREHQFAFAGAPRLVAGADALVIVHPIVGYSREDVDSIRTFLSAGGNVLLADDSGSGKDLLDALGVGVEITPARVFTPSFEGSPQRIVALSTGVITDLPHEVVVTAPVGVVGGRAVLVTPGLSWRDENGNGRPDLGEPLEITTLASIAQVGKGHLLVLADPDLMSTQAPVVQALVRTVAPDHERLVFDEAHGAFADPLGLDTLLAGRLTTRTASALLVVTLMLGAFAVLSPRFARDRRRNARITKQGSDPRLVREALAELDRP